MQTMLHSVWSVCFFLILYGTIGSTRKLRLLSDPVARSFVKNVKAASTDPIYSWSTAFFDVPINNFAYINTQKFAMKYLYNNTYYKIGGPIFFYAGNEAAIEGFAENTGIMFDLAPRFNASIVFAEHRYYGESKPFGDLSYSDVKNLGFLTSTQAMADFAKFLPHFKANVLNCSSDTPVIAFGGSYGGMLAAWFRIKYPHIVTGAWASSAPVLLFKGANVDPGAFDKVVTEDFIEAGCNREAVYKAFNAIHELASTTAGLTFLNEMFVIEAKSNLTQASDADYLVSFIREAFGYLAMVNYPYPTSFLLPLPGWPVKEACKRAQAAFPQTPTTNRDLVNYLYIISNLYYNYTGTVATNCVKSSVCGDQATAESGDDAFGWPWQSCTELVIEMCARGGSNDFFYDECQQAGGVLNLITDYCLTTFSSIGYNKNFLFELGAPIQYGLEFSAASNIIFTNGNLDPWSVGGVFANTSGIQQASENGVYTYFIEGSAHHLDLRQPNTCDPAPVKNARFQIVNIIDCWVHPGNCSSLPTMTPLPPLDSPSAINCQPVVNGYPWGQQ